MIGTSDDPPRPSFGPPNRGAAGPSGWIRRGLSYFPAYQARQLPPDLKTICDSRSARRDGIQEMEGHLAREPLSNSAGAPHHRAVEAHTRRHGQSDRGIRKAFGCLRNSLTPLSRLRENPHPLICKRRARQLCVNTRTAVASFPDPEARPQTSGSSSGGFPVYRQRREQPDDLEMKCCSTWRS